MKRILIVAALSLVAGVAHATCTGMGDFATCMDQYGNNYTVNRMGNMTTMQGYNAQTGSSWSQNSATIGNTTTINGNAANGANWNEAITNMGNGYRTISGTDSQGNSYYHTCTLNGCY